MYYSYCAKDMRVRTSVSFILALGILMSVFAAVRYEQFKAGEIRDIPLINISDFKLSALQMTVPTAPGTQVSKKAKSVIDYSNINDGYIMIQYLGKASSAALVMKAPTGQVFNYKPPAASLKNPAPFTFTEGSGKYTIQFCEPVGKTARYTVLDSLTLDVKLKSKTVPFLVSNYYVQFDAKSNITKTGETVAGKVKEPLKKVEAIYNWTIKNISYDKQKAATVQSGYVPDLNSLLKTRKGICFDFAAAMSAMLRSQGVPTRLVVGYAGSAYHAWISVWTEATGWIDNVVYFDGKNWVRMDPTFAASAKQSDAVMKYIGDGKNYKEMFSY